MKKLLTILCVLSVLFSLAACGNMAVKSQGEGEITEDTLSTELTQQTKPQSETQSEPPVTEEELNMPEIEIIVGSKTFSAALYDNTAANELINMLPLTMNMSELNGNEKYCYLDADLPTNASRPSEIRAGDIMLYGKNCLVIFYEGFTTSYSYTPIGHIDDSAELAAALGSGSVQVTFRKG